MARSTVQVLEDHLPRRSKGDIGGDLEGNYVRDVVLLCEHGVLKGHAVRKSAKPLADQLPGACLEFSLKQIDGDYALLHWSARSANAHSISVWTPSSSERDALFCERFLPTEIRDTRIVTDVTR
jgi:hypothetical protein